jgi:hypothetical protein
MNDLMREHEAPEVAPSTPQGYTPTPQERGAIKLAYKLLEKAKTNRKRFDDKWLERYKMFRGQQWKEQRPSYRHSEVINMIFQHIQATVPLMTDSRPRLNFVPKEPNDFELSQILNKVSESDWEQYNWLMVLTETIFDAHFYGAAICSLEQDPKAEGGIGAPCFESMDPFYVFPDPEAREVNDRRSRFFVTAEPVDVKVLKQEYPDKAKYLKADLTDLMQDTDRAATSEMKFRSPTDTGYATEYGGGEKEDSNKDKALKITVWIAPNAGLEAGEIIEEKTAKLDEAGQPAFDEAGQPAFEYLQKLRYPNGRKICVSCGVLLHDGPNPYDDRKFPYAKLVNYIDPRSFWGISEIEQLEGPQRIFNKLVSFALDVLTLMGNPVWVVDTDSEVDTDNLFNRPGLIIEKQKGTEVRREEGVQLQPYVLQLIDRMKTWFDDVGGDQDVSRGVRPEGITAASAINSLQEAAKTRIRLKTRNVDAFLQQVGQLYLSRVFQFYSAPRMFRLTNNQNVSQYFKFHVETMRDEQGAEQLDEAGNPMRQASLTQYSQDDEGKYGAGPTKVMPVTGNFDVSVNMGSSLPFAKEEKISLAKFLMEAGAIDSFELLKAVDYPNAEAVYQQVQEREMQKAQQQAAMAPPPGAEGSAPPPPAAA